MKQAELKAFLPSSVEPMHVSSFLLSRMSEKEREWETTLVPRTNYSSYKVWLTKGFQLRLIFLVSYGNYYVALLFLDLFIAIYIKQKEKERKF